MSKINDLIKEKLQLLPSNIRELAQKAIELSETGLPEASIVEYLQTTTRQILKKRNGDSADETT